jgi:hypothetical protein
MHDLYAMIIAQGVIPVRDEVHVVETAQDRVAERARHERRVALYQRYVDVARQFAEIPGAGRTAEPSADHDDPPAGGFRMAEYRQAQ